MSISNTYLYARISRLEDDIRSFKRQINVLKTYSKTNNFDNSQIFKDDSCGYTFNRPEWNKVERLLIKGDTIIFNEISRFIRDPKEGYIKYIELMKNDINLIFLGNPALNTDYIKNLIQISKEENNIKETTLKYVFKVLFTAELRRIEKKRIENNQKIKQGMAKSSKKPGKKIGTLDKMNNKLREDIFYYLEDENIKQVDVMKKHGISRDTLKKYAEIIAHESLV